MDEGHIFYYLVSWRINIDMLAVYAVYFFLNSLSETNMKRKDFNDIVLARYE